MTPHHLHAAAAAWSLQAARGHLAQYAADEAAQINAEAMEVPSVLRSPVYGSRTGSGGHGDPTPGMVGIADRPDRRNRWAEMGERLDGRLEWLANQVAPGFELPLGRILLALDDLQPGTAAVVAKHLQDEDGWIRKAVGVGPDRAPLLGVACPHCDERQLHVQTAGPIDAWTVVCATGRLCIGVGCPCGMPGAVEGVAHIWPRAAVITSTNGES
ncbi:hypothetical protein OHB44_27935 [Micromonospora sp. NBC_00821]|uniref:hypothetical protein n=1 Tax=Micromonospora sp. NBC_00821 TaxID=2975977 RepID=UPI002ED3C891|nr:hypothetical protein OHB44_27935 [Micromonospora sp. NBC_00821]